MLPYIAYMDPMGYSLVKSTFWLVKLTIFLVKITFLLVKSIFPWTNRDPTRAFFPGAVRSRRSC